MPRAQKMTEDTRSELDAFVAAFQSSVSEFDLMDTEDDSEHDSAARESWVTNYDEQSSNDDESTSYSNTLFNDENEKEVETDFEQIRSLPTEIVRPSRPVQQGPILGYQNLISDRGEGLEIVNEMKDFFCLPPSASESELLSAIEKLGKPLPHWFHDPYYHGTKYWVRSTDFYQWSRDGLLEAVRAIRWVDPEAAWTGKTLTRSWISRFGLNLEAEDDWIKEKARQREQRKRRCNFPRERSCLGFETVVDEDGNLAYFDRRA